MPVLKQILCVKMELVCSIREQYDCPNMIVQIKRTLVFNFIAKSCQKLTKIFPKRCQPLPKMTPTSSRNRPKTVPKSFQNPPTMTPK